MALDKLAGSAPGPRDLQDLEDEITELSAHLAAATYRLLCLIHEFDERSGWNGGGVKSCAHWLNWKCGIALGAAREKVRVAHALAELPQISSAFRCGKISYSKVRAMTRVATSQNEDYLLMIANHGTAAHVERLVRNYRKVQRIEALRRDQLAHESRELSWYIDDDGSYVFRARISAEQGARVAQALNAAIDVSAETPIAARRADALERVAEVYLAAGESNVNGGDRCTTRHHVDAHHIRHWADGGETRLDNLVLLCRHHHRLVHEGGYVLQMGTDDAPVFSAPNGDVVPAGPDTRFRGNVFALVTGHRRAGFDIGPGTIIPYWCGDRMDAGMAVDGLLNRA